MTEEPCFLISLMKPYFLVSLISLLFDETEELLPIAWHPPQWRYFKMLEIVKKGIENLWKNG